MAQNLNVEYIYRKLREYRIPEYSIVALYDNLVDTDEDMIYDNNAHLPSNVELYDMDDLASALGIYDDDFDDVIEASPNYNAKDRWVAYDKTSNTLVSDDMASTLAREAGKTNDIIYFIAEQLSKLDEQDFLEHMEAADIDERLANELRRFLFRS